MNAKEFRTGMDEMDSIMNAAVAEMGNAEFEKLLDTIAAWQPAVFARKPSRIVMPN
jgi:hypothetical protein